MGALRDLYHKLRGLSPAEESTLRDAEALAPPTMRARLRELVTTRHVRIVEERFPVSAALLPVSHFPVPIAVSADAPTKAFATDCGAAISTAFQQRQFAAFAPQARTKLLERFAPELVGLDNVKEALILQLAMPERFHVLLLGDPGTGKTDLLRASCDFAPISSFGLGSGSSKAGLAVMFAGTEARPGLLAQANGGICAIDELNLLKPEDRAALYNAMEKGFVSYDKGGRHERFEADIRLLATANPTGDRFTDGRLASLRKQLPFDAALLSRFHLVFVIHKPDLEAFRAITASVLRDKSAAKSPSRDEDAAFLKAFLAYAREVPVSVSPELEDALVTAVTDIKRREADLLIEVTPRLVKGLRALTVARARLELRREATHGDVHAATHVLEQSIILAGAGADQPQAPRAARATRAAPTRKRQAPRTRVKPRRTPRSKAR